MKTILFDIIEATQDEEDGDNLKPSVDIDDKDSYRVDHPELEEGKPFSGLGYQAMKEKEATKVKEEKRELQKEEGPEDMRLTNEGEEGRKHLPYLSRIGRMSECPGMSPNSFMVRH